MCLGAITARSWFAVFNNPRKHGYGTDIEDLKERAKVVCDRLLAEWCTAENRVGAWSYCVKHYVGCFPIYDEENDPEHKKEPITWRKAITDEEKALVPSDFEHVHMVLEDGEPMAFGKVKNTYAIGMHFEPTRGKKKEAEDYICKTGDYDERPAKDAGLPWEEIIYHSRKGDISGRQGKRTENEEIDAFLEQGLKPPEIMAKGFKYYKYETAIKKAYFDRRIKEVPFERQVIVFWHYGDSGSGKSYYRNELEKKYGADEIFYMTNFQENSRFDGYYGQKVLWMEDFKGEMKFGDLLRVLDKYKATFAARYANVFGLWEEVHITSIYHPLGIYNKMIKDSEKGTDKADQLLRRISGIMYHYKIGSGENVKYEMMVFPSHTKVSDMQVAIEKFEQQRLFSQANFTQVNIDDGEELPF